MRDAAAWVEAERQAGTTPEALYKRLVKSGKSGSFSRNTAANLLPERSRHPIVTLLAYFSLGLAGLFSASGAHTALDLAYVKQCVPAASVDTSSNGGSSPGGSSYDKSERSGRVPNQESGEWVFTSQRSDWLGVDSLGDWLSVVFTGSSPSSDGVIVSSVYMGLGQCEEALEADEMKTRQSLARWLSLTLLTVPTAIVTLRMLATIDRRDRYARLFPYRFKLNTVLLSVAATIGGLKLLTYLTGVISILVGATQSGNMITDFGHLIVTLSITGGLLIFSAVQYRRWRAGWNAAEMPAEAGTPEGENLKVPPVQ